MEDYMEDKVITTLMLKVNKWIAIYILHIHPNIFCAGVKEFPASLVQLPKSKRHRYTFPYSEDKTYFHYQLLLYISLF